MSNVIDYVQAELRRMSEKPFGVLDSLALAELAYVQFTDTVPEPRLFAKPVRLGDLYKAELFDSMFPHIHRIENENETLLSAGQVSRRTLLFAMAASPRFRDIRIAYRLERFDVQRAQQFAAVTFLLEDNTAFIAYRGTDSTIVGWKEDFNMAFISPVPSQEEAAIYLDAVAKRLPGRYKLRIGGHSKGGNLAVYAAMKCQPAVQNRILQAYNHDGPGFKDSALDTPEYQAIERRVVKILPQSSLVGMLLSDREDFSVVESTRSGLMQHDAFSWEVSGDDFVYAEKLTGGAIYMQKTLNQWLETLPDENRRLLVDALFQVIETTHAETLFDLSEAWGKSALTMLGTYRNLDVETRRVLSQIIRTLLKLSVTNLRKDKSPKVKGIPSDALSES